MILSQPEENTENLIENLLKEYNGDAQTIGEVLLSRWKDVRGKPEHNQYRIMREKLIEKGFDTNKTPIFKILRNSSSHGEFYPIIRGNNDIDIKIDNESKEKQIMSLQTLLTFVDSKISTLPNVDEYSVFIEFYRSTDLLTTMEKYKKQEKTEILRLYINGFEVYVGKNNRQNDYIVSKLAKDEDYWFHTRLCAGSHVLLKVKDKEPEETVLFECCKLARENSSASQPSKVGVIYTKAKNLRKPPASPLGYVTYKNEKEVLV